MPPRRRAATTHHAKGKATSSPPRAPMPRGSSCGTGLSSPVLETTNPDHLARYNNLSTRTLIPNRYLDHKAVEELGISDRVNEYLDVVGWNSFAFEPKPVFEELTLEFLSTLTVEKKRLPKNLYGSLRFTLCGQPSMVTVEQLNAIFGFKNEGFTRVPYDFLPNPFWHLIAPNSKAYDASSSKSSRIADLAVRYLHRFMAFTIWGRGGSQGVVTKNELFFLWCMLNKKAVNTGMFLSRHLDHIAASVKGKICVGGLVTTLAQALHGFDPESSPLQKLPGNSLLSVSSLSSMNLVPPSSRKRHRMTPSSSDSETSNADTTLPTNLEVIARIDALEEKMDQQHAAMMDSINELKNSCEILLRLSSRDSGQASFPLQ